MAWTLQDVSSPFKLFSYFLYSIQRKAYTPQICSPMGNDCEMHEPSNNITWVRARLRWRELASNMKKKKQKKTKKKLALVVGVGGGR